jgi:hypothetical protein
MPTENINPSASAICTCTGFTFFQKSLAFDNLMVARVNTATVP